MGECECRYATGWCEDLRATERIIGLGGEVSSSSAAIIAEIISAARRGSHVIVLDVKKTGMIQKRYEISPKWQALHRLISMM